MACMAARSCLILVLCLMMIKVCVGGRSSITSDKENSEAKLVPMNLYYETLCPGCSKFITEQLPPTFVTGLMDIIELRLVPWGNAVVVKPYSTFQCQHGPEECKLNTIEACTIDAWPSLDDHFLFIECVESLVLKGNFTAWETCFQECQLDPKPVKDCYFSGKGNQLEQKYAEETMALQPPLEFVPWVVVDGKALKMDLLNLKKHVCKAYKGPPPEACKEEESCMNVSGSLLRNKEKTLHTTPTVCYTDNKA